MKTKIDAHTIRYENDTTMFNTLLRDQKVIRVNKQIEKMAESGPMGTRRRLLTTAVRLTQTMAPQIHKMSDECVQLLGIDIPLELYVYSSPQFNAACFKPEEGRLFVILSSSLLEGFEGSELKYVLGHEFGHYIYRHHDIPVGYLLKGDAHTSPRLALDLFAWSRNAEISADRAGAFCANDLEGVAHALFKLASGLSEKVIQFTLNDFLRQIDEMHAQNNEPGQGSGKEDWFSTHPFSPLRMHALKLFHDSELMCDDGITSQQLEVEVHQLMGVMEPSYMDSRTDIAIAMQRCLYTGAISLADIDGEITAEEIHIFEQFFGPGAFDKDLNIQRIKQQLSERIQKMKEKTTPSQRMQVLRDLCVMSKAKGRCNKKEQAFLEEVAQKLGISPVFVCQTAVCDIDLD